MKKHTVAPQVKMNWCVYWTRARCQGSCFFSVWEYLRVHCESALPVLPSKIFSDNIFIRHAQIYRSNNGSRCQVDHIHMLICKISVMLRTEEFCQLYWGFLSVCLWYSVFFPSPIFHHIMPMILFFYPPPIFPLIVTGVSACTLCVMGTYSGYAGETLCSCLLNLLHEGCQERACLGTDEQQTSVC